jgi:hypothetical protein
MDSNKFVEVLKSRKFWAALVGLVVVFAGNRANVPPDQLTNAVILLVSYILGTALQDGLLKK